MDRERWAEGLTEINWLCGRCQEGRLRLSADAVHSKMTGDIAKVFHEDWFDRDDIVSRFTTLASCDNRHCGDPVAISGTRQSEHYQVDWDEYDEVTTYTVSAVTPAPLPFPMPKEMPDEVELRLRAACQLLWADHDAGGNKIRQAIEALLDDQRVRKAIVAPGKGGAPNKRRPLNLHQRIEEFSKKNQAVGDHLMAIKWIGNAGSHAGRPLTRDDILDALEIMEQALEDLYVKRRAGVLAKVKKIVSAKKPLRR